MLIKLALTLIGIKMEEGEGGGIGGVPLRWSRDWVTHAITGRIWKHTRDLYRSLSATPESQACASDSLARHVELWLTPPPPNPEDTLTPGSVFCSCSAFWALRADSRAQYVRKAHPGDRNRR